MAVYSVSQVTTYMRQILEQDFLLQDIWVSGEIANLARPGSGHSYFTLREGGRSLRCVMFRTAIGAERLGEGAAVITHGRVSIYEVRGDLQLIVDMVQPEGMGELQLRLEQLRLKLESEGLFEPSRKRDLPRFPKRVGVITSPTGAVWQDIQTVVLRRYPLVELVLAPTPVQGETAVAGIVGAFETLNQMPDIDAIILARGGGSLEDLWPFNEEAVAHAIFSSRVPVVSAVGHETDVTIADMVADRRAPTPSAAAEMAVPDMSELANGLLVAERALDVTVSSHLAARGEQLSQLRFRLDRGVPDLDTLRLHIDDRLTSASTHLTHGLQVNAERLQGLRHRLTSLSPIDTLRRGYAIIQRSDDGSVVNNAAQVGIGDSVGVILSRGSFDAEVISANTGGETDPVRHTESIPSK
ncbi:MAG: exodeoxyribonuclease VII large subunit [Chloroflexi bacterium]|nr:exodeoxyribonuclease VII large subunit [Chloroflexota bacterium]